jgi:hypothetical protein
MAISLPGELVKDIRQPILGDSFAWAGVEPAAAKKTLVIHHSASPTNQDGFDIASYHVNSNGWGGIGYHFVITHDDYQGRPAFGLESGAQIQYVGDLLSWRAHVENGNPGRVGICLVGNFVNGVPGPEQLKKARQLVDFLMAPNEILPSINYYSQVTGHGLIEGQSTACPGYANPNFNTWMNFIKGGGFPEALYTPPAPPVQTPPPAPAPTTPPAQLPPVSGGMGGGTNVPVKTEQEASYVVDREDRTVLREGAFAFNVQTGEVIEGSKPNLVPGKVVNVAGYFTSNGKKYARTVYSSDHNLWNGVDVTFFDAPPTGQVNADDLPITVVPKGELTDQEKRDAFLGLPPETKVSLFNKIIEAIYSFIANLPIFNKGSK